MILNEFEKHEIISSLEIKIKILENVNKGKNTGFNKVDFEDDIKVNEIRIKDLKDIIKKVKE